MAGEANSAADTQLAGGAQADPAFGMIIEAGLQSLVRRKSQVESRKLSTFGHRTYQLMPYFPKVWSATRLNWSIVTRTRAPRQVLQPHYEGLLSRLRPAYLQQEIAFYELRARLAGRPQARRPLSSVVLHILSCATIQPSMRYEGRARR